MNPLRPPGDRARQLFSIFILAALLNIPASSSQEAVNPDQVVGEFLLLVLGSEAGKEEALAFVDQHWQPGFAPMLLEVLPFSRNPAFSARILGLLETRTGQSFGFNLDQWQQWQWRQESESFEAYGEFKSALYGLIDERFENYFGLDYAALIRLDEVLWGGVMQDGIPPLNNPSMFTAAKAGYLADDDVVFGLELNGDARAYPRRILAWHEMFVDEVGGEPVAGVYCTLCGTMILYKTRVDGVNHKLGTSGFLYRSNKLMYDKATQSLWNTFWGKPVIGPLVQKDITLERMSVVTTTWGEWKRRHPDTLVLSPETGFSRDYSEGAAYRDYFATDDLMFTVPVLDTRLKNKAEILGLLFPQYPDQPIALSAEYLSAHPLYQDSLADLRFVVVTDASGANRVYEAGDVTFSQWDRRHTVEDTQGVNWQLEEARLRAPDGRVLHRLPAQRAFWFGWYSAYSHTALVH